VTNDLLVILPVRGRRNRLVRVRCGAITAHQEIQRPFRQHASSHAVERSSGRPADGRSSCFGYVQTYDSKPKRRLFEVLASLRGCRPISRSPSSLDGGDDIRDLPRYLNPQAEHLLDWFHLAMRITVLTQLAKGPRCAPRMVKKQQMGGALSARTSSSCRFAPGCSTSPVADDYRRWYRGFTHTDRQDQAA